MEAHGVFITGANRGIGLELVRQMSCLPKPPTYIFATYRSSESLGALSEIKKSSKTCQIVLLKMDVQKEDDVASARKIVEQSVGEYGLTLLINNAGVLEAQPFPNITEENLLKHFTANTVGPIRVFQELYPLLQKAASHNASKGGLQISRAAVVNISSRGGSITRTGIKYSEFLNICGYRMSKTALNMGMRVIAANVKDQGILVVLMCPGYVKTDMGTERAELTTEESVSAMIKTFGNLNDSHHGTFMDKDGNPYPF